MSISIYLNNLQVQIVSGKRGKKGVFQKALELTAPEGSIINGIIMDRDSFVGFLNSAWTQYKLPKKDVNLVVNSNKIPGRMIDIPVMSKGKTEKFIVRELADMQRDDEEQVICYHQVAHDSKTKMRKIYAEIAARDLISDYLEIFQAAGIQLKSIVSAEGSIIGLLQETVANQYKTFVLQITNGNIVSNILWIEGTFNYFNSVRCFNEVGTEAYYEDCARSLSNLNQFMQAHKIEAPIERIVIAGTERTDVSFYGQMVDAQGIDAPVEIMNKGLGNSPQQNHEAQQAIFAVSGLFERDRESSFLEKFSKGNKKSDMDPELKRSLIIIGSVLATMLLIFAIALFMRLNLQSKYDELVEYNENPTIMSQALLFDSLSITRDRLSAEANSIQNVIDTIDTYPILDDNVIDILEKTATGYADIEIGSFDAESGIVNVAAKAKDVELINQYVYRLEEQDIFNSVKYSGYTMNDDGSWTINVLCTFAEGVGREGE